MWRLRRRRVVRPGRATGVFPEAPAEAQNRYQSTVSSGFVPAAWAHASAEARREGTRRPPSSPLPVRPVRPGVRQLPPEGSASQSPEAARLSCSPQSNHCTHHPRPPGGGHTPVRARQGLCENRELRAAVAYLLCVPRQLRHLCELPFFPTL